jgi:hypothetical protein
MNALKPLAGLVTLAILVGLFGAASSVVAAFEDAATVATAVLVTALVLAVVGAGVGGAGGSNGVRTPYW